MIASSGLGKLSGVPVASGCVFILAIYRLSLSTLECFDDTAAHRPFNFGPRVRHAWHADDLATRRAVPCHVMPTVYLHRPMTLPEPGVFSSHAALDQRPRSDVQIRPSQNGYTQPSPQPRLLVLCSWMGAGARSKSNVTAWSCLFGSIQARSGALTADDSVSGCASCRSLSAII